MADDPPRKIPNTQRVLDIAVSQGSKAARRALDKRLAKFGLDRKDIRKIEEKRGFAKAFAAAAVTRLATRSVPGALFVGGAIAAKALLGRRKGDEDPAETLEKVDEAAPETGEA